MKYLLLFVFLGVTGTVIYQVAAPGPRLTFGVAGLGQWTPARFSPDGKTILANEYYIPFSLRPGPAQYTGALKLWDVATGKVIREYEGSNQKGGLEIYHVGFSHDGKHVLACGRGFELVMWETASGKVVRVFPAEPNPFFPADPNPIQCFGLSPDGSKIVTLRSVSANLQLWDLESGKLLKEVTLRRDSYTPSAQHIFFSKDAKYFVLDGGTEISIWDLAKVEMLHYLSRNANSPFPEKKLVRLPHNIVYRGLVLAPDGQGLLVTTTDGKITELDLATAKEKRSFELKTDKVIHALALSPKGDRILTAVTDREDYRSGAEARLHSFPECKELNRMPGCYGRVQFSPDGKAALTFTKDGRMMLWDLEK